MNSGQHNAVNGLEDVQEQSASTPGGKAGKRGPRYFAGRDWYLFRVDLFLDGRVPSRRRRGILKDLRNSIDAESEMNTLHEVLAGLGNPRVLASSYVEGTDQGRPQWTSGVMAALITLTVYWFLFFSYSLGMLAVTQQTGGEFHSHFIFVNVSAFSADSGIGMGWSGAAALWFPLALAAVALLTVGRVWRIFRRHPGG